MSATYRTRFLRRQLEHLDLARTDKYTIVGLAIEIPFALDRPVIFARRLEPEALAV
jgi:hypothetical protein